MPAGGISVGGTFTGAGGGVFGGMGDGGPPGCGIAGVVTMKTPRLEEQGSSVNPARGVRCRPRALVATRRAPTLRLSREEPIT